MSRAPERKVALITGASSGIGRAFSQEYARRGIDIVAVARKEPALRELAEKLQSEHSVEVTVLPGDLADPETPDRLFQTLAEQGKLVTHLVNNAGFGVPGLFCDVDWSRHRACLEVMSAAPVRLCHLFAPAMRKKKSGTIINVSSLSALLPPHAGGTLYYPVKSFLYQFSLALRAEMRPHNVHVTALCPGFTETNFQKAAGGTVETVAIPKWLWSNSRDIAKEAIRAVEANRAVCIPGFFNRSIAIAFKLMPGSVGRWIVRG